MQDDDDDGIFDPPYRTTEERDELYRMMKENDRIILERWNRRNTNPFMWLMPIGVGTMLLVFILLNLFR